MNANNSINAIRQDRQPPFLLISSLGSSRTHCGEVSMNMITRTKLLDLKRRQSADNRSGIVLLVVLGMLTLFSVLGVSYLVFTSRQRAAAFAIQRAEKKVVDPQPLLDDALGKLLVGATGPDSSLWGHDLLADLYGMRDAVQGEMSTVSDGAASEPALLLGEFVRIPTELYQSATYPNRRFDGSSMTERFYPQTPTPTFPTDDELSGRILTFTDGPLRGISMKIVRYFGNHVGATNGRSILSGQLVLDLRPHLQRSVTVDSISRTETLADWIKASNNGADPFDIADLFYDRSSATPDVPLSDFYINGRILNGPGLGWDVKRDSSFTATGPQMNLEETISADLNPAVVSPLDADVKAAVDYAKPSAGADVPVSLQGHFAIYRREPDSSLTNTPTKSPAYLQDLPGGDTDESYDAPDDQNWWLSYFPTDPQLGTGIPSFVRPALVNWLVNQEGGAGTLDAAASTPGRLQQILRALQRSTLRPLAITNDPAMPASPGARGPGVLQLDYSSFTGGNTSALGTPIDYSTVTAAQIRELAEALAGVDIATGNPLPVWDVDNNGDQIPDGVWVDSGAPLTQDENGKLIKPLVSYLVEDLSGRANVNLIGNLAQAQNRIQRTTTGILYRPAATQVMIQASNIGTHTQLPVGFGYGPAEIDLRPLFVGTRATGNGPFQLLRRRLNESIIGGNTHVISGQAVDPLTTDGNDYLGAIRQPQLENLHSPQNAQGLPVDKFGRASVSLGIDGGLMVSGGSATVNLAGSAAGDAADDPYEMDTTPGEQPDRPFTLTDLEAMLRFDDFDRDALDSALAALAEAHFTGTPIADVNTQRKAFADSITTISNSAADNVGILPAEYHSDTDSRQALTPQAQVTRYFPGMTLTAEQRNGLLMQILPQSILAGGKMDLNRPFGNGIDDDGDGTIDDPEELRSTVEAFYQSFYQTVDADVTVLAPNPGGSFREPTPQALFARHLYVLALSVVRNTASGGNVVFDLSRGAVPTIDPSNQTFKRPGTPNTALDEFRAWRIAQWAINVADFRDSDGIMSRFDYDVDPFDGWDITTIGGGPSYRTVWGMEYPELALEESLAFHDRRVRDTNLDALPAAQQKRWNGSAFQDEDPDQWRLPQGSLFLELRNTRSPDFMRVPTDDLDTVAQAWGVPKELYSVMTVAGNQEYMLNLAKTASDGNPVWRVAITRAHPTTAARTGAANIELSADELIQPNGSTNPTVPFSATLNRLAATMQPERPDFFGPVVTTPVERVIWFGNQDPDPDMNGIADFAPADSNRIEQIFYNRYLASDYPLQDGATAGTEVFLRGGQYAVIGPRTTTHVGSLDQFSGSPTHNASTSEPIAYNQHESPQRFELFPNDFEHLSFANNSTSATLAVGNMNATRRESVGVLAAANPPTGWTGPRLVGNPVTGTVQAIGVNVSEPLPYPTPLGPTQQYYPTPAEQLKGDFPLDSWYDYTTATGGFPDIPFDGQPYAELRQIFDVPGNPPHNQPGQQTGTRERFKTAYLQRLADPTQPYDAVENPYRTVDYLTIDLTVFNGSEGNKQETDGISTEWIDQADPDPFGPVPPLEMFATRYKTGRTIDVPKDTAGIIENLSHSINTFPPQQTNPSTVLGGHVPYFNHSLLLDPVVDPDNGGMVDGAPTRTVNSATLGYANSSYGERWSTGTSTANSVYAGTPISNWFSSVAWLNRPFVSKDELMLVPASSAAGFLADFGTATADTGFSPGGNVYDGTGGMVLNRHEFNRVFPHLWNYFSQNSDFNNALNMYRILDWVDVPAPFDFENDFIGTNPNVLNTTATMSAGASKWSDRLNYTALGGSVTDNPDTWDSPPSSSFWLNRWTVEALRPPFNILQPQFRQGRINLNTIKSVPVYQALMAGGPLSTNVNGAYFTEFITSRRGYLAGGSTEQLSDLFFHPDHASQVSGAFRHSSVSDVSSLTGPTHRLTNPLGRTIHRPGGTPSAFTNDQLFSFPVPGGVSAELNEFADRSALHRELPSSRLSNLASDQSNTFAVWITVGLFEVDSATLSVGDEVGSNTGQRRRFRSFHIIDRSIPVMYQPGQMNNARDTVVLSRNLN